MKLGFVELQDKSMSRRQYLSRVAPIAFCQALAMGFGTFAYLSLTVAFIQMLKVSAQLVPFRYSIPACTAGTTSANIIADGVVSHAPH